MKRKLTYLIIFASAGAFFQTGPTAFAGDTQSKTELRASTQVNQSEFKFKRASELIGTTVRNQQDEQLGDIRDLMVDLQSGRVPFAVLSSGGFFGVGSRLVAVPPSKFAPASEGLMLNLDKAQLESAPSFERDNWPDMSDKAWSSQAYSYYGETPYWESSVATITEIREPAGSIRVYQSDVYSKRNPGLSEDRRARQGLGAEDLTRNEQKTHPPGYAASRTFIQESAGAGKSERVRVVTTTKKTPLGKVKRASELIGMEVKNTLNEHVGEIQDLVINLQSGRVAYAVLDAGTFLNVDDKFHAVPPTVFTRSADEKWLILKTDKAVLKSSPSFDKGNWPEAASLQFTKEVYSFYGQKPYWPSGSQIQEPSGSEQKTHKPDSRDSSGESQNGASNQSDQGSEIQEPAGAEPERQYGSPKSSEQQSSAARETAQVQSATESQNPEVQEPAGATTERVTATRQDQTAGSFDQQLSQRIRAALQADSALSSEAKNVRVSAANGKITLQGTVASEQEKQAIADKVKEIALDNQLEVKSEPNP